MMGSPRVTPLALLLLTFLLPTGGFAQEAVTAGGVLGLTSSRQVWTRSGATGALTGILLGGWIRVPTPLPHLAIRAEASYAQRGAELSAEELQTDESVSARLRGHYLSVPIHGELSWALGPFRASVFSGPTVEYLLGGGADRNVSQFLGEEASALFGLGYGVGVATTLPRGYTAAVEARGMEGISGAYTEGPSEIRNRSLELLLRVGMPVRVGGRPDVAAGAPPAPPRPDVPAGAGSSGL